MAEKISRRSIVDASKEYMMIYGWNKNAARVTPGGFDGLKPGKRRAFYAWWETLGKPENPKTANKIKFLKVETISGNSMRYHPHSNAATTATIGREGQYWNNNVMTITPKGNYGSMRGDPVAAARYIEAKPSQYMIDCFFDEFSKYSVPMTPSYDGDSMEPEYFPAKYPHLLFNPQFSGIGWGASSNIPPFNVTEVLRACIKLLKNPDAKIKLIPDIPTGCDIVDIGNFNEINETGVGKVCMRAGYEIDYQNNIIKIRSLPYTITSSDIIKKIINLQEEKKIDGVQKFKDSSQAGDVVLDIILKPDASPDKMMQKLLKKTDLEFTLPISISVVEDFMIYDYGIKEYLLRWLEFRENTLISRYNKELQMLQERIHILDILIDITSGSKADEVVKIIRKSDDDEDSIKKLIKLSAVDMTSVQAKSILRMAVGKFNKKGHEDFKEERKARKAELKVVLEYLQNPEALKELMINQFEDGIKKYGGPRRSKIISDKKNINVTEHLVAVSENGYIKKIDAKHGVIGTVGKSNAPLTVVDAKSTDRITMFSSEGYIQRLNVSDIPDMEFEDIGLELSKFSNLTGRVVTMAKNLPIDDNAIIYTVSKYGLGKGTITSELGRIDKKKKLFVSLSDGDEIVSVVISTSSKGSLLIYTNIGNGIRIPINSIILYGRTARGSRLISLRDNEVVSGASLIAPGKPLLAFITSAGKCKTVPSKLVKPAQRAGVSSRLISLDKRESLIGACGCSESDAILCYKRMGEPTQIEVADLSPTTCMSKGEKLVKTPKGDSVIGFVHFES